MATKHYCDACGIEIDGRVFEFNYLCHIENDNFIRGYIDTQSHEPISGRVVRKELCLSCYNKIYFKAYEVYKSIVSK